MFSCRYNFILGCIAAVFVCLLVADAARAQQMFVTSDTTLNSDVSGNDIFVGKDNLTSFNTLPGTITTSITNGAIITGVGTSVPNTGFFVGLNLFGDHHINMSGGSTFYASAFDTSTFQMTGGLVRFGAFASGTSTFNIQGGTVTEVSGIETAIMNISGGNITNSALARGNSVLNITGGTVNDTSATDSGTLNISGGTIGRAFSQGGRVNISGGTINTIFNFANNEINLTGGTINSYIRLDQRSTINIYGTGLSFSSAGTGLDGFLLYNIYTLSGTLQGGQSINGVIVRDYEGGLTIGNPHLGLANPGNLRFITSSAPAPESNTLALMLTIFLLAGVALRHVAPRFPERMNGTSGR